jgi:hypothetical protein
MKYIPWADFLAIEQVLLMCLIASSPYQSKDNVWELIL